MGRARAWLARGAWATFTPGWAPRNGFGPQASIPSTCRFRAFWGTATGARSATTWKRSGPDVLHTHLGYADLLGGLAARSLEIPALSTLHVMDWAGPLRERAKGRLMALARQRCCHRVIAVSDAARQVYLDEGYDRPERVVVVHNGIHDDDAAGSGANVRAELGLAPEDIVITMATVLRQGKGHEIAAAAVERLREAYPAIRLVVLGDGPDRTRSPHSWPPWGSGAHDRASPTMSSQCSTRRTSWSTPP